MRVHAALLLLLLMGQAFAQETTVKSGAKPMPPTEALQYAMAPYNDARQQPDDLTDADRWALGISIARAAKGCKDYIPWGLPKEDTELLAMGRLCIVGQQYEQAREALVGYLALPKTAERETAFLLLSRAFLGLGWITSAESQMDSLLSQFPYDANIHYGIDQVVDEARAQNAAGDDVVHRLDEQQLPLIMKALHGSGSLTMSDKSATVSTAVLFRDALRCAAQLRADGKKKDAASLVTELSNIVADPKYAQSAQLPTMQAALKRYEMYGQGSPVLLLRGKRIAATGPLLAHSIDLKGKTTVLLPVVVWSPASSSVVEKVAGNFKNAGEDTVVYAITSFAANSGGEDEPDPQTLPTLRAFRQTLPATVPLLVVPDSVLEDFAIDSYPSGILVDRSGTVRFLEPLSTAGAIRALKESAH